ncbi:MAG: hypothetical protein V3R86_06435 [Candidatus Hydrothermarchaeaceae archaeon]
MIEKDIERKIAFIHAAYGFIVGILFGRFFTGDVLPFLSVLIWGVALSYPGMIVSKKMFNLSAEDFDIKAWLGKGFFFFFSIWIVVWIFMYNIR